VTPNKLVFLGVLGLKKPISSYSFDRIVLIFGYRMHQYYNSLEPFFAISILNPNYDVINDVISGFASFRRAMRIAPPAVNHRSVAASSYYIRASCFPP